MNILLDTHIAIWVVTDDKRLSHKARHILLTPGNKIYCSAISALEIDIKTKSKNNNLDFSLNEFIAMCKMTGFISLPLRDTVISETNNLVWNGSGDTHKDPFDRMLLAQAIVEGMYFMTSDKKISYFQQDCVMLV